MPRPELRGRDDGIAIRECQQILVPRDQVLGVRAINVISTGWSAGRDDQMSFAALRAYVQRVPAA